MILTDELKQRLLERLRAEFEDDAELTPVVERLQALPAGYDMSVPDRDPGWDELVDDVDELNWVWEWLEYFDMVTPYGDLA
jgi:hypothetical protein